MNRANRFTLALFCAIVVLGQGCSKDEKATVKEDMKDAENSVEKAYDRTTDALRGAVEGVNDAVYK